MAFPHDGKKFQAGQSGNPNGRPKKLPDLDKLLAEVLGPNKEGRDGMEVIIEAMLKKAAKGDVKAAELLLNRGYGKAKQFISMNHEGGVNLVFEQATANEGNTGKIYGGIQEEQGCLPTEETQSYSESGEHPIG
jgi:hypothetical protein